MNFLQAFKMNKYLLILFLLFGHTLANAELVLSFGVVPQQSASKSAKYWNPILNHLSQQSGVKLRFATAPDIPTFEKRLAEGEYDFAYMNPYHYVVFNQKIGYQAINKAKDKKIKGIIVVAKNSNYLDLKDLDHKTLAFPAPASFAASILTQTDLELNEVSFIPKYVLSHDSVYRAVAKGLYPAGGGVIRTFKNVAPDIQEQLKFLWVTKGYTPHAIASHPRVSERNTKKIQQALININKQRQGLDLLQRLKIKGFEKAHNDDWDDIRELQITRLKPE